MQTSAKTELNEYMSDFISSRYLCLERAADEYIQAENELSLEKTSEVDRFIDLEINIDDDVDIDNFTIDNDLSFDDLDEESKSFKDQLDDLENEIASGEGLDDYDLLDDDEFENDQMMDDINIVIDMELEPDINELDGYDEQ